MSETRKEMKHHPDKPVHRPSRHRGALSLDTELYQDFLDDPALSEDAKREMLEALWGIIVDFVSLGFAVHPLQQACGKDRESALSAALAAAAMVKSNDHANEKDASDDSCAACREDSQS